MKISCKYMTILLLFVSFVSFNTISNELSACGGGGSSPDGITLKLRGVNDLAEAIQLKATLQKNEVIKCANISPDKTEICISTLCPGAITEEQIIKAIKDAGYDASLPDYLTFKIDNFIHESDVKRLRECLDELPGVTTANIDLNTKDVTINYYEGWIRFARKIVKTLEDNGFKAIVPIDAITFETEGMAEVDAHDVRAYLLGIFGVSGSDVDIVTNEVMVSFYRGWTTKEKLIKTIEERGNTKVKHDLTVLKTS
ncbi:MAG: copper chaperone [Candidatus Brocadia sp.]|nr:copper chaperone [Candidatus Brocadia sp.]